MGTLNTSAIIDLRSISDKNQRQPVKERKYMPSISDKRKEKQSSIQRRQEAKSELATKIIRPLQELFNVSFIVKPNYHMDFKDPISHIVKDVIPNPDLHIHWSKLYVCVGKDPATDICYAKAIPGKIAFFWDVKDSKDFTDHPGTDLPIMVAYDPGLFEAVYMIGGATYGDGMAVMDVKEFEGLHVHVYIGFANEKGKTRRDSNYVGKIKVL